MFKLNITILFILSSFILSAQSGDIKIVDQAIKNLQAKWQSNTIFSLKSDSTNNRLLHTFLNYRVDHTSKTEQYQLKLNDLKRQSYLKDYGISGSAGYLENLDPAPDDDNLFYFRRIQTGIKWDVLRNGFVGNRYRAKEIEYESELTSHQLSKEKKEQEYISRWHSIVYMFNQVKTDILNQRLNVVETQLQYAREFYRLKLIKREDLLGIEARLAEIKAMFGIYTSYNEQIKPDFPTVMSYADNLPVFDLNYDILFKDFSELAEDSILHLSEDWLKYKTSFVHDIALSAFVRYNWYDIVNALNANRSFVSMGINVSVPIPFNNKIKKEITRTEFELDRLKEDEVLEDKQKDLLNYVYEFRYKLKQYVNFYEKRVRYMELLRQENVLLKLDPLDFNPVKALGLIDDILDIDIELTELNQNMYLKALKLYTALPYISSRQILKPFFISDPDDKETKITRGIYLWSDGIKSYNAGFIEEYLKYNQTDEILMSVNKDPQLDSLRKALLSELKDEQVKVHLMIGNNELIQNEQIISYLKKVSADIDTTLYSGIHLDIEPHVLNDYKQNKTTYLDTYIRLLQQAGIYCKKRNLKLSVSVPLHYPEAVVQQIFELTDKVYFMAYENVDTDYILRKISPYANNKQKIVIALRTEDFENRLTLEQKFDELLAQTGILNICLHDFSSLFELDRNLLKGTEQDEEH